VLERLILGDTKSAITDISDLSDKFKYSAIAEVA